MRGIAFERCGSPVGRNAVFCGQRFRYEVRDRQSGMLRQSSWRGRVFSGLSDDVLSQASCLVEALSVRDGALQVQGFSRRDIQLTVDELSCSLLHFILFYFIFVISLYLICCTTCMISIINK
jgi:hypothetical protein